MPTQTSAPPSGTSSWVPHDAVLPAVPMNKALHWMHPRAKQAGGERERSPCRPVHATRLGACVHGVVGQSCAPSVCCVNHGPIPSVGLFPGARVGHRQERDCSSVGGPSSPMREADSCSRIVRVCMRARAGVWIRTQTVRASTWGCSAQGLAMPHKAMAALECVLEHALAL